MSVTIREVGQAVVTIDPGPHLTLDSSEAVKEAVCRAVAGQCKAIVLDMSNTHFIDSQGLELLLWIRDYCQLSMVSFRLAGLDQTCRKILEITRLADEFGSSPDLASAVKSLA